MPASDSNRRLSVTASVVLMTTAGNTPARQMNTAKVASTEHAELGKMQLRAHVHRTRSRYRSVPFSSRPMKFVLAVATDVAHCGYGPTFL